MFVSDTALNFMGSTRLKIVSAEGQIWDSQLDPSTTIEALKRLALQHFYPLDTLLSPDSYRVIYPFDTRTLGDTHAIYEESLQDNDMLMLVRKRTAAPPEAIREVDLKPPTAAEILAATKDLPVYQKASGSGGSSSNPHPTLPGFRLIEDNTSETNVDVRDQTLNAVTLVNLGDARQFQLELRKIIISLVSVMSTLLHGNGDADLICQQMHSRLTRRLKGNRKPMEGSSFQYPPPPEVECTPMGIVSGMAEARKRDFRPNLKALESMREMGFKDEQIVEALRATKNSKDVACEWIITGKKNPDDADTGLDPNTHLFSALVSAPTIRLGLSNPKTLLAFLNILESPAAANVWLNDSDTAPVLSTIFKIYHAEKHAAPDT